MSNDKQNLLEEHDDHKPNTTIVSIDEGSDDSSDIDSLLFDGERQSCCGLANLTAFMAKLCFFSAIGGFLFGYDTGVISGAILFIEKDFSLSPLMQEVVVSGAVAGAIVGALVSSPLNVWLGRKKVILFADVLFAGGSILMMFSPEVVSLVIGRIIVGLGIGIASMTVPIYIAEAAPSKLRGALVTMNVAMITFGQFCSYAVDAALASVPYNWRWMLGAAAIPATIQFFGMLTLPESARWLLKKGREHDALVSWQKMRVGDAGAAKEFESIKEGVRVQAEIERRNLKEGGWRDLYRDVAVRKALFVGVMLQVFQQFVGINTVMYYSPTIIQMAGIGTDDPSTAIETSMFVAAANFIMTLVTLPFIDKYGRRILLMLSLVGVWVSLVILSFSFGFEVSWLSLFGLISYTICFAPGMGPIPWTVNSEIYPLKIRELANSIATMANWVSNLVVALTFLNLTEAITPAGAFLLYANIALVAFMFFFFMLPETKGRTLTQIQDLFLGQSAVPTAFSAPFKCCGMKTPFYDLQVEEDDKLGVD